MRFRSEFAAIAGGLALATSAIAVEQAAKGMGHVELVKAAVAVMFASASAAGCGLGALLTADVRQPQPVRVRRRK